MWTRSAWFSKAVHVLKYVWTWYHTLNCARWSTVGAHRGCICEMWRTAYAVHVVCLYWWIRSMRCSYLCQRNAGKTRCKDQRLVEHIHCDVKSLEMTAVTVWQLAQGCAQMAAGIVVRFVGEDVHRSLNSFFIKCFRFVCIFLQWLIYVLQCSVTRCLLQCISLLLCAPPSLSPRFFIVGSAI